MTSETFATILPGMPRPSRRSRAALLAAGVILLALLALLASLLTRGQDEARRDLRSRFALRAELAAGFLASVDRNGLDLSRTEDQPAISAHLATVVPIQGQRAYLVDRGGRVLAASRPETVGGLLRAAEPALGDPTPGATPIYQGIVHRGEQVAASAAVPGHTYRVVITVPTAQLYFPLRGTLWPQWLLFSMFAAAGLVLLLVLARLFRRAAELEWSLRVDPVTGVRNRRHLQERLAEVASAGRRHGRDWAVLMIDVDHFKAINDQHGHAGGDDVLRVVAGELVAASRMEDLAGRWGGDEFLVILPDTGEQGAVTVAERIAAAVRTRLGGDGSLSIGCAAGRPESPEALLQRADQALYQAKQAGRGRVAAAQA